MQAEVIDQIGRVVARGEITPGGNFVTPGKEPGWPVLIDAEPPYSLLWPDGRKRRFRYDNPVWAGNWLTGANC